jgi:methylated-DNA-protein-cysteine methyltransferase-like protein
MRFFEQVYALVRCIPPGRVASYGQIARLLGQPHAARTVGWALRGLPEGSGVPWHRVVNAAGRISLPNPQGAVEQRRLLEAEGVVFDPGDRVDVDRFGWDGLPWPEIQVLLAREEENDEQT